MVLSHFFSLFFLLLFFNCLLCSLWKFKEQKVMSLWSDKWCRVLRVWQIRIFLSPELLFASVISWVRALGALGAISLVDLFLLYHRVSLRTFSCLPSILSYTHLPTHSSSSYVPPPTSNLHGHHRGQPIPYFYNALPLLLHLKFFLTWFYLYKALNSRYFFP